MTTPKKIALHCRERKWHVIPRTYQSYMELDHLRSKDGEHIQMTIPLDNEDTREVRSMASFLEAAAYAVSVGVIPALYHARLYTLAIRLDYPSLRRYATAQFETELTRSWMNLSIQEYHDIANYVFYFSAPVSDRRLRDIFILAPIIEIIDPHQLLLTLGHSNSTDIWTLSCTLELIEELNDMAPGIAVGKAIQEFACETKERLQQSTSLLAQYFRSSGLELPRQLSGKGLKVYSKAWKREYPQAGELQILKRWFECLKTELVVER